MRPALRPRLLGHLRDMLAEKEQDIVALRARLRTSEELKGDALGHVERLEAQVRVSSGGFSEVARAAQEHEAAEAAEQLQASRRLAEQLQQQLSESQAEVQLCRARAGEAQREVRQLQERVVGLLQLEQQAAASSNQLSAREAEVLRLERRVAELEGCAGSGGAGGGSAAACSTQTSAVEVGASEPVLVSRSLFGDGPSTSTTYEVSSVQPQPEAVGSAGSGIRPLEPLPIRSWRGTPPAITPRQPLSSGGTGSANCVLPAPLDASVAQAGVRRLASSASAGDIRPAHTAAAPAPPQQPLAADAGATPRTPQPPLSPSHPSARGTATVTPIQQLSRSQSVPTQTWRGASPRQQHPHQQQGQAPLAGGWSAGWLDSSTIASSNGFGSAPGSGSGFGGAPGSGAALGGAPPLRTAARAASQSSVSLARWAASPAPPKPLGSVALGGGQAVLSPMPPQLTMGPPGPGARSGSSAPHMTMVWR